MKNFIKLKFDKILNTLNTSKSFAIVASVCIAAIAYVIVG